jgi:hypothetical protein
VEMSVAKVVTLVERAVMRCFSSSRVVVLRMEVGGRRGGWWDWADGESAAAVVGCGGIDQESTTT